MAAIKGLQQQDQILNLGSYRSAVEKRLKTWENIEFSRRLWIKDPTLWGAKPQPEITDRMGWLELFEPMHDQLRSMMEFAESVKNEGLDQVVLLGMGGSSLAPEVFQRTFGNSLEYPELVLLDSTHPDTVRSLETRIDLSKTLFLISSKSGTTTETLSFLNYFWNRTKDKIMNPGLHFAAITDPGTPLLRMAQERGFRKVFQGPLDVGGRYSALTLFGLVPASLIGADAHLLLDRGWDMAGASASYLPETENACLALGAALGELALAGRDKVTFFMTPTLSAFPFWLEQLIAESTGKNGKGIVPVVDEPIEQPWVYRKDRAFVCYTLYSENNQELNSSVKQLEDAGHPVIHITLKDKYDLGQEMFRWEMAVAAAGAVMGVNPFDQPDVQLAKDLARQAMEQPASKGGKQERVDPDVVALQSTALVTKALDSLLADARLGDYVAIQAFLAPRPEIAEALQEFRLAIRDRLKLATSVGWGPRFLHSTGQLHKGGPNTCVIIQLVDEPAKDLPVPDTNYTFGALIHAQALGEYRALKQRGRRLLRIQLGHDAVMGAAKLIELL
jgi:transaldolase/glucose-6-phosphate isomerase